MEVIVSASTEGRWATAKAARVTRRASRRRCEGFYGKMAHTALGSLKES